MPTVAKKIHIPAKHQKKMRGRHFAAPRFHLLLFFLISLLVSAVACIALFTANRHEFLRRLTIMHLQSATNSLVQLDDISINPKGHVSLRNLAISDPANPGVTIAAVKTIDIQFSPAQLLAFPTHPIEAIHRVVITRPRMQLSCDRQGRWNFDYIFRGKRTSRNGKFQGEIIVNDGEIIGHDGYGWQTDRVPVDEHFVHLNARLSSAGNRVMPFHITAVSASGHARDLSVNGILRRNNESVECLIRLGSFDLKFAQKFLGKRLPFEMLSGRADARWQLVVARNNRNNGTSVKMTLITDVHQVTGRLHTGSRVYQCFISQGQVRYAPSVVEFVGIDGRVNDIPITLNGTISNFGDIIFALHGHVNQADGNRLSELIPGLKRPGYHWSGAVTGTTQITGHLRDIQVTGHFQGLSLSTAINGAPLAVTNINSDVQYCGDTVRLTNVSATAFGGMIHGSAWLNASNNPKSSKALLLLQCTTAGLNAKSVAAFTAWSNAKLANQLSTNIAGSLSGPVSLSLTKDNTFTLISSVQGIMSYGSYGTAYANTGIEITAGANQSLQTSINHAELMTPYGYFRIQGSLNTATLDLSLQGNEVRLAAIGKLLQRKDVDGKGFVSGKISGSFDNPVFTGNIRAQNGKFANRNFAELSSEVSCSLGTSPLISLKNIRLLSGGHQLELSAAEITTTPSGKQWSDGQWHVQQIALSRSRLSSLAALIGLNLQVDGFAEGTVEYADFPKGVKGKGTIALNRPSVQLDGARIAFDRMTIDFSLRDEHTIDISDAKLTYEGQPGKTSTITITGSLSTAPNIPPNKQLTLHVTGKALPVTNFTSFAGSKRKSGTLTADGRVLLPVDLGGNIDVDVDVNGQLLDAVGKRPVADLLANTLTAYGMIKGCDAFSIAHVPYRQFESVVAYDQKTHTLTMPHFVLSPADGKHDYMLTLSAPSAVTISSTPTLDLHFMLQSATPTEHNQQPTPANIADFRHDLVAIAEYTIKEFDVADNRDDDTAIFGTTASSIAASDESKEFLHYLSYIPEQLSGKMACNVDINQSIDSPAIQTKFSLTDIAIDHQPMPTVNADLSFDTASRTLSIQQLTARGGPDPNAELRVDPGGRVKFPLRDAQGNELQPGQLSDIVVETQNLNPSYFSHWNSKLGKLGGEMNLTIFTLDNSTTSRPQLKASIDWKKPEINGIDLDVINATMTLDNDPTDPSVQRLWIGQHGFSTIQLKNSDITDAKPLEISGYLPVRWLGLTASPIPDDKPFSLKVHIPDQPLQQLALDYLPKLSNGKRIFSSDGTISGTVQVGGTLREPEFEDSSALYVKSSEVTLPIANSDIPNRLSNLNVDLSLIAEHENNKVKNAIILNDVSSFYDRADKKVKKPSLWDKVKVAIGIDKPKQTPLPCIVMRGSIEIPTPTGGVASFADFSAQARAAMKQIHYDIYAKTLRTPISWGELFKGTMTSYLHLGNSPSNPARPRITGLIYSEDSKVTYTGSAGAQVNSLQLPFDPELSLLIQVGQKNALVLEPKNAVLPQGSVWAQLPLIPTGPKLFSPDAVTDPVINSSRLGVKPFLSNHPLHLCNAETLDDGSDEFSKGSYGKVTGSLSKPVIDLIYQLEPEKSQVQLPGGLLVVDSMQGTFHCDLGASEPAKLIARGSATGTLDRYGISANVDGDLLTADHLPVIALATTSTPPGSAPLTPDEIWNRLIGVDDIVALVRGEQSILSPVMISKLGPNMLLGPWMRGLASAMRLNTLSLSFDQSWNPETTLTTPEFGKSRWSSFRLGASGTITDIPTWRVWLDYTIPTKLWWLQNLAVTAEVSNQSDSINSTTPITATTGQKYFNWQLQYTIPFKTTLKNK